jgi:hypothetical protein
MTRAPHTGDQMFLRAILWGPQDYAMRAWIRTDWLTGLNLTVGDIVNAIQSQNIQAAVGRIGARPISNEQQLQLNIQTKGGLRRSMNSKKLCCAPIPMVRESGRWGWHFEHGDLGARKRGERRCRGLNYNFFGGTARYLDVDRSTQRKPSCFGTLRVLRGFILNSFASVAGPKAI